MIKHKCHIEVVINEHLYSFNCDHHAPLPEVIAALTQMRDHAQQVLDDAIKQQEEAKPKEEANADQQ